MANVRAPRRVRLVAAALATGLVASVGEAAAQPPRDASPKERATSAPTHAVVSPAADEAHARMKRGDCAGALDLYDQAARATVDPTVRRDRGACHERLGHPYPAIDDYRYYLTNRPDAPDAEAIRERLTRLEEQVGMLKPGGELPSAAPTTSGGASARGRVTLSLGRGESSAEATAEEPPSGPRSGGRPLDAIERDEALDIAADDSPLRRAKGFGLGVAYDQQNIFETGFGWSERFGVDLRYSVSKVSTLMLELGYAHVNATGSASALGGGVVAFGYEARIGFDPRLDNALLLGVLATYEHLAQPASGLVYAALFGEGRVGYRHVFGPSFGIEGALDAGPGLLHLTGDAGGSDKVTMLLGGHVALVLGF